MTTKRTAKKSAPTPAPAPAPAPVLPEGRTPMRILEFHAENFMGIQVVDISPKGSMVQLTGKNGSGKSSILDAIECVLRGTTNLASEPIRRGERKAVIKIDTEEYTIIRRFTAESNAVKEGRKNTGYLEVWSRDGKSKSRSAQHVLDQLFGQLSFDPIAFLSMDSKRQLEALQKAAPVDVDFAALAAKRKQDYEDRRELTRSADDDQAVLTAQLKLVPESLPETAPDLEEIGARLAAVGDANAQRREALGRRAQMERDMQDQDAAAQRAADELVQLQRRMKVVEEQAAEAQEKYAGVKEALAKFVIPNEQDASSIQKELRAAGEIAEGIRARETARNLEKRIARKRGEADELTKALDEADRTREAAIARAKMPVAGLSYGDGEVLYRGLPLAQASTGEQFRVAVALGMASNPVFRVLRIKDGSLLDDDMMAEVERMAEQHQFQVWVERVGKDSDVGFVISEGKVVKRGK